MNGDSRKPYRSQIVHYETIALTTSTSILRNHITNNLYLTKS